MRPKLLTVATLLLVGCVLMGSLLGSLRCRGYTNQGSFALVIVCDR